MTSGAYREAFDVSLPSWAAKGGNALTNQPLPNTSLLPVRSNAWFGANANVLYLDTENTTITNTLAYDTSAPVVFNAKPVYVDMRVKFDVMTDLPDPALLNNAKMAFFLTSDAKLVAVCGTGSITNGTALDTNTWYQVTIRMFNSTFDVLINDAVVFTGLPLKGVGTANTLAAVSLSGTGLVDDLYVSHGDPKYGVTGPTGTIPTLPGGSNPRTDEEQTKVNAWLSSYAGINSGTTLSLTQEQLNSAYLLNALGGDGTTATYLAPNFGIQSFDLIGATTLHVTFKLKTGDAAKSGTINGKIQLYGSAASSGPWVEIGTPFTPTFGEDGTVTPADFTVVAGQRFFHSQIVP